jgi:outer membrane protein OmpA-like peptidoglycan-associated protein
MASRLIYSDNCINKIYKNLVIKHQVIFLRQIFGLSFYHLKSIIVMASKKYSLLAVLFCLTVSSAFSQRVGSSYDVKDSSLIPSKRMPLHSQFLEGSYNFPAKPRNQWEVGIAGGMFTVSGDLPARVPTPAFSLHVRKAFGYVFSVRLQYLYGIGKGLSWLQSENYYKNTPWTLGGYHAPYAFSDPTDGGRVKVVSAQVFRGGVNGTLEPIFYNYKTNVQDLSLQGIVTLNQIRFHKSKTNLTVYGFGGVGATVYDTKVNALNGSSKYNFTNIGSGTHDTRKDKIDQLKAVLDDSYESPAENHGLRRPKLFGNTLKPSGTIGMGVAFKLSNRINLAIEDRHTFIKDDLLDGQRWQEGAWGDPAQTRDFDSYNALTVGLNINLGAKAVEPLWWLNPLDYAYAEIRNPRLMRLPKPVLPDNDGDGVTDQFDQEQTPQGCPVNSHGVTLDTDGDGVPDCKDKELITPSYCQPVDADGIGKCPVPCPDSTCPIFAGIRTTTTCSELLGALPSVSFKGNRLDDDARAVLSSVASRIRNNAGCKVVVVGYCASNKKEQQLSWDHVNAVITYMVEKEGISADRFIFNYGNDGGDCNTVDLRAAADGEEGPNTVPAPHPNLRKK